MKRSRLRIILALLACACLFVAACSPGGASTAGTPSGGSGDATATTQPTAKPKPTAVPKFTVELCSQLLSLDEMNTMIQPKAQATAIVPTNGDTGGACNYEASKTNIPLIIYFLNWTGPTPPIPQSDIDTLLSEAAGADITINTAVPVTGIGDQAEYVEATGSSHGFSSKVHVFYVIYGKVFFDCVTYGFLSGGTLGSQSQLQACAQQVVNRL